MTALDILVLLLVGGAGVLGFMRGFTTEALSLVAWVLAILAVRVLHQPAADALLEPVGTAGGAAVLAFALVFGITFLVGRIAAGRIGARMRQSALGSFDRILGVGFGAVKGLLIAAVIYLGVSLVYDTVFGGRSARPDWMTESRTYPLLDAVSRSLVDFVNARREQGGAENASNAAEANAAEEP